MSAELHERFLAQIDQLAQHATATGEAARQVDGSSRPWGLPDPGGWDQDPLAVDRIAYAFDRDLINQAYDQVILDAEAEPANHQSDAMALKRQVDWLAAYERAFRLRHATSIRATLHSAARRLGHGHAQGCFQGGIVGYLQDLTQRGQET